LNWSGTDTRLATGLLSCWARSASLGGDCAAPPGACAASGTDIPTLTATPIKPITTPRYEIIM
jgi:hypothetical protein